MTGFLRLSLSILVLISHLGIRFFGLNEGVIAVVIFYILAGHVVTFLFIENFNFNIKKFYQDRFLRIFPVFWLVAIIYIIFLLVTKYGNPIFNFENLLLNLSLIPLNYYMYLYTKIIILTNTNPPWYLIPPAWSLGAEFQFYLLVPFLLRYPKITGIIFIFSLVIYSFANLDIINSDYFGYRLLPGVIFIFLIGVYLQKLLYKRILFFERILLIFAYIYSVLWFIIIVLYFNVYGVYTRETLLGIILGVPLVFFALRFKIFPFKKFLGDLSYVVYLMHFLIIWFLDYMNWNMKNIFLKALVTIILTIVVSSLIVKIIEKTIEQYRLKIKN